MTSSQRAVFFPGEQYSSVSVSPVNTVGEFKTQFLRVRSVFRHSRQEPGCTTPPGPTTSTILIQLIAR